MHKDFARGVGNATLRLDRALCFASRRRLRERAYTCWH
jgi:hypothetical protein